LEFFFPYEFFKGCCFFEGFTIQEGTNETVEYYLFEAFKRAKLIETRETSNYHRCGRTDKGDF
jgi:tRNA pseudouridine38/39 synthase